MKLGRMTDYAITLTTLMARTPKLYTVPILCAQTGLSQSTVAQILKRLTKAKVLSSVRGAHGGYCLALGAEAINMAHIVEAMEGQIALTRCLEEGHTLPCTFTNLCHTKSSWAEVNAAVKKALSDLTLEKLAQNY